MTGNELRAARLELGWSQQRLADELSLTRGFVCDMEAARYAVDRRTELSVRYLLDHFESSEDDAAALAP